MDCEISVLHASIWCVCVRLVSKLLVCCVSVTCPFAVCWHIFCSFSLYCAVLFSCVMAYAFLRAMHSLCVDVLVAAVVCAALSMLTNCLVVSLCACSRMTRFWVLRTCVLPMLSSRELRMCELMRLCTLSVLWLTADSFVFEVLMPVQSCHFENGWLIEQWDSFGRGLDRVTNAK